MKESELKIQREKAMEYAELMQSVIESKYFPEVLKAVEKKDEKLLDSILTRLEVSEVMRDHVKAVVFAQPMAAAPMWG